MDKNKSIDGLKPRRSQKKSTPKKTTSPKKVASNKKSVKKSAAVNKTTQKTVKKTKKNISLTTTPLNIPDDSLTKNTPQTTDPVEDFLNPIQTFDFDEVSGNLKATAPTNQTKVKKHRPKVKKPMSKKRKIILSIIFIILLLLLAAGVGFILWGNDIIAKITGGQGNVFDLVFQNDVYEPLKTDSNGRTNILAFGTSGYNMDGEEGNGVHDGAQLTDSIMVISLDQETGDIAMLSLPRDLKASPTCTATGKINEVYWCNNMDGDNESAGAKALMEEVSRILGIDFQYYAHLNWGSLIQIVDALGGITVTLDEDISDYYYTGAVFEAGKEYTINGDQALGLARARHGTESGDFSRGASQQKILVGIKDKILEKGLSITEIINLASALGDNLRTNFSIDEIKTLAHLSSELDFNSIRQISLIEPEMLMTTGTINGISYVLPVGGSGYYTRIQDYVAKMFSSDPRNYENYTIIVLNASETPGLAASEKTSLEEDGYDNIETGDTTMEDTNEEYILYSLTDTAPGVKKLLEEKYNITSKTAEELPQTIPHEYDFVVIVNNTPKTN